jgi:hypothetical protein
LVAVTVVFITNGEKGEASGGAFASPGVGIADASTRALDASGAVPSDELGDTEMTEAVSTIRQIRQRMNTNEYRDAKLPRADFMISSPMVFNA